MALYIENVSYRTVSFDVPPQEILTKDSVTVAVDAVVYYNIRWFTFFYIIQVSKAEVILDCVMGSRVYWAGLDLNILPHTVRQYSFSLSKPCYQALKL